MVAIATQTPDKIATNLAALPVPGRRTPLPVTSVDDRRIKAGSIGVNHYNLDLGAHGWV